MASSRLGYLYLYAGGKVDSKLTVIRQKCVLYWYRRETRIGGLLSLLRRQLVCFMYVLSTTRGRGKTPHGTVARVAAKPSESCSNRGAIKTPHPSTPPIKGRRRLAEAPIREGEGTRYILLSPNKTQMEASYRKVGRFFLYIERWGNGRDGAHR